MWWRGPLRHSFVVVAEELLSPTPLPPPFGWSPLPAFAGRDEVEGAKRVARTDFFYPPLEGEGRARRARGGVKASKQIECRSGFTLSRRAMRGDLPPPGGNYVLDNGSRKP